MPIYGATLNPIIEAARNDDGAFETLRDLLTPLTKRYIKNYSTFQSKDDLRQVADQTLLKAIKKYQTEGELGSRPMAFERYYALWLQKDLKRYVAKSMLVPIPETVYDLVAKLSDSDKKVLGSATGDQYISEKLGLDDKNLENIKSATNFYNFASESYLESVGSDDGETKYIQETIKDAIDDLPNDLKMVVILRFGFNGSEPFEIEKISKILKLTHEEVEKRIERALELLRELGSINDLVGS